MFYDQSFHGALDEMFEALKLYLWCSVITKCGVQFLFPVTENYITSHPSLKSISCPFASRKKTGLFLVQQVCVCVFYFYSKKLYSVSSN